MFARGAEQMPPGETLAERLYNEEISEVPEPKTTGPEEIEHATIEDLGSVLLTPEEIPPTSKREFALNLYNSFKPCQKIMSVLMRFPIVSYKNDDHSIVFEYNWYSLKGSIFFITFAILTILTLLSTLNIVSTMLNFPNQPDNITVYWTKLKTDEKGKLAWEAVLPGGLEIPRKVVFQQNVSAIPKDKKDLRAEEMFFFRRNMASLLIVLFLMYHILIADWNLYGRRHFVASYLTYWTESVEIMKIDAAGESLTFFKRLLAYYLIWFILFCFLAVANFAPVASGAPVSFAFLWIRCAYPQIHSAKDVYITVLRSIGGFVYLYVIFASKIYVFFFLYICKILTNACTVWNERFEKLFTAEERAKSRKEKCLTRTGYDHLFKDYVNLLDLMKGADTLFANIVESYFTTTIISMVFEIYYLVRPFIGNDQDFQGARTLDVALVGVHLFNSLLLVYLVSTGAAEVGEASAQGLETIRRQGILGHRSDPEMHLMISLYMSYTGHFGTSLSAGGYFILDKAFFVAVAGTMITYIIIILQFQPSLGITNKEQTDLIGLDEGTYDFKVLLFHIEKTFLYRKELEPGF